MLVMWIGSALLLLSLRSSRPLTDPACKPNPSGGEKDELLPAFLTNLFRSSLPHPPTHFPQYLFIWSFDSTMIFDRVLDQNDQWALDQTYLDFIHKDVEMQTSLFSVYLWNVTNAEILLREGFKPYLSEAGPFGYVKNTWKYDVVFTPDSHFVTYKQYNYYTPTPNPADCYHMFFRMDKAIYSSQEVDCSGTTCHCVDDEQQVNVINPKVRGGRGAKRRANNKISSNENSHSRTSAQHPPPLRNHRNNFIPL